MFFKTKILENEYFWGGDVNSGYDMPIGKDSTYSRDFRYRAHNQFMPMFISSKGRYVWSETGFKVCLTGVKRTSLKPCIYGIYRPFVNNTCQAFGNVSLITLL